MSLESIPFFNKTFRGRIVALLNNATPMRPGQIWVRPTENLTVKSGDEC